MNSLVAFSALFMRRRFLWLSLIVFITGGVVWFGRGSWRTAQSESEPEPESTHRPPHTLVVTSGLHLGELWESRDHRFNLDFHNAGVGPIHIRQFHSSCSCIRISAITLDIPPGETKTVAATVDLMRNTPVSSAALSWPVNYSFDVDWSTGGQSVVRSTWRVDCVVKSVVSLDSRAINYFDVLPGDGLDRHRSVIIKPIAPIGGISIVSQPLGFDCELRHDADEFKLIVCPNDFLEPGQFANNVMLQINDKQHQPLAYRSVQVAGTKLDKAFALPATLRYGLVAVGDDIETSITIKSSTTLQIRSVDAELPADMALIEAAKNDGDTWRVKVRHRISDPGSHSSILKFKVNLSNGEIASVSIPTSWYARDAKASK